MQSNPTIALEHIAGYFYFSYQGYSLRKLLNPISIDSLQQVDLESYSYLLAILPDLEDPVFTAINLQGEIFLCNPYPEDESKEILMRLKTSESFQLQERPPSFGFLPICPISLSYDKMTEDLYVDFKEQAFGEHRLFPLQGDLPDEEKMKLWRLAIRPKVLAFAQKSLSDFYDNIPF